MKKPKITPCIVTSRESMSSVVSDIVALKLRIAEQTTLMEQEILAIQNKYKERLVEMGQQLEIKEAGAYIWCQSNPREFGEKKSIDFVSATVGYRTCPPKVSPLFSKDSDKSIARRLEALSWGEDYLSRPDPKPDKDKLLADRNRLTPEQLRQAGIKFEQEEVFYIEPKSQIVEASTQQAA